MGGYVSLVEPLVVLHGVGTSFFEMALTLTVYNRSLENSGGQSDGAQALSMRFTLLQSVVLTLGALLSAAPLTHLAQRWGERVRLLCPLLGSVLGMGFLLALLLLPRLPLEVLYAGAALHGLSGGTPGFWSGVAALASLQSNRGRRTLKLNTVDFCAGAAGVLGGLLSGYVYRLGQCGLALVGTAMVLTAASMLYSACLLSFPQRPPPPLADRLQEQRQPLLQHPRPSAPSPRVALAAAMAALVLFDLGMYGAESVLSLYVLKPPLSWNSVWAGYGSAATQAMYLSSFLGVLVLSPHLDDTALILMGIVSNCTGMAIMAFATQSWVYFLGEAGFTMIYCNTVGSSRLGGLSGHIPSKLPSIFKM